MARAFSWFLAIRYLLSRWVNLLGMVGVALAVWALIVVVAVFTGFISDIRANTRNAAPDVLVTNLPDDASYAELDALIREESDVVATAPRIRLRVLYYPLGERPRRAKRSDPMPVTALAFDSVELLGVDFTHERAISNVEDWLDITAHDHLYGPWSADPTAPLTVTDNYLERARRIVGQPPRVGATLRTPPGLLLGTARATQLVPGQEISIVGASYVEGAEERPRLRKLRRVFALSGGFLTENRVFDQTKAIVDIEELRDLLGHSAFNPNSIDIVTDIGIKATEDADLDALATRLEARIGERLGVGSALTWVDQNRLFLGIVDQERGMMKLILFVVVLVSVFLIYATMHMMVTQKIKDIGVLSAMGASRQGVGQVFLLCGVTIAVIGCLGGATLGCLTSAYLDYIDKVWIQYGLAEAVSWVSELFGGDRVALSLFPPELYALKTIPTVIEPAWVAQVTIGAFVMTLLAAWIPARRAARMEPVQALSYE